MDKILIVGVESVVGANLAAAFPESCSLVGVTTLPRLDNIGRCEVRSKATGGEPGRIVSEVRPQAVVYCGAGAVSCWDPRAGEGLTRGEIDRAGRWAKAAAESGARFVLISSDAVFGNPWMFHEETCESLCGSPQAEILRGSEARCLQGCSESLIVRTHAFGWSPAGGINWVADLLARPENGLSIDPLRYATPILASDLAELLYAAMHAELTGTWHIAGGERISHAAFVERLLDRFGLPLPARSPRSAGEQGRSGFGRGETTLASRRIRRALGQGVPLLGDGLDRFAEQTADGYCERLHADFIPAPTQAAWS